MTLGTAQASSRTCSARSRAFRSSDLGIGCANFGAGYVSLRLHLLSAYTYTSRNRHSRNTCRSYHPGDGFSSRDYRRHEESCQSAWEMPFNQEVVLFGLPCAIVFIPWFAFGNPLPMAVLGILALTTPGQQLLRPFAEGLAAAILSIFVPRRNQEPVGMRRDRENASRRRWRSREEVPVWDVVVERRGDAARQLLNTGVVRDTSPDLRALPVLPEPRTVRVSPLQASKAGRVKKTSYHAGSGRGTSHPAPLHPSVTDDSGAKMAKQHRLGHLTRKSAPEVSLVQRGTGRNALVDRFVWLLSIMPFFRHWGGFV